MRRGGKVGGVDDAYAELCTRVISPAEYICGGVGGDACKGVANGEINDVPNGEVADEGGVGDGGDFGHTAIAKLAF